MSDFEEFKTTILGEYGEEIVKDSLKSKGYLIQVWDVKQSHPYDFSAYKNERMKHIEVKTKAHMIKYKTLTGLDERDWQLYKRLNKSFKITICFVDYLEQTAYGATVDDIEANCMDIVGLPSILPANGTTRKVDLRIVDIKNMHHICNLTKEQCKKLEDMEDSNFKED